MARPCCFPCRLLQGNPVVRKAVCTEGPVVQLVDKGQLKGREVEALSPAQNFLNVRKGDECSRSQ